MRRSPAARRGRGSRSRLPVEAARGDDLERAARAVLERAARRRRCRRPASRAASRSLGCAATISELVPARRRAGARRRGRPRGRACSVGTSSAERTQSHGRPPRLAMSTSSDTLPFDSVAIAKRALQPLRPATASGQGSSRCQTRLRCVALAPRRDASRPKRGSSASRIVRCSPSRLAQAIAAAAHALHRRLVAGAPGVGERRPVDARGPSRRRAPRRRG